MLFVHFLLLGVTHRDLKLENILLSEDNQPIVTDFGFARYIGSIENQRARSRTFCGSYAYVAPEILQGTHVILDCYLVIAYGPFFPVFWSRLPQKTIVESRFLEPSVFQTVQ